jgi:hypothetical protein
MLGGIGSMFFGRYALKRNVVFGKGVFLILESIHCQEYGGWEDGLERSTFSEYFPMLAGCWQLVGLEWR